MRRAPFILVIVAAVGILACFGYLALAFGYGSFGTMSPEYPAETTAKYIVSGSATSVRISYTNEQHETEMVDVSLPWAKEMDVSPGATLSLAVQNLGTGSITCELSINNLHYGTSTSTAQYGVVACTNRLP